MSNLTRIASGLRNAASLAIDPATGDLVFADNGIDGNSGGNEAWSTDELDRIPAAQIGGSGRVFRFPGTGQWPARRQLCQDRSISRATR